MDDELIGLWLSFIMRHSVDGLMGFLLRRFVRDDWDSVE
jgi:hypothetical protein